MMVIYMTRITKEFNVLITRGFTISYSLQITFIETFRVQIINQTMSIHLMKMIKKMLEYVHVYSNSIECTLCIAVLQS